MTPANGAEALAAAFERQGVTHVFGLPGTQNARFYSALEATGIRPVLAGSELMAAFMANGFHRSGGSVPVVATIPGPGFTFALTGFAEAAQDNAALILVTGEPDLREDKRFGLQAIDQAGMVAGLARGVHRLENTASIAEVTAAAGCSALEHGPGPVLLEVNRGVLDAAFRGTLEDAPPVPYPDVDDAVCAEIASHMAAARRVVIVAGQGVNPSAPLLERLVGQRPGMVLTTVSARGVLPESHPWSLAYDFLACSLKETNRLLEEADFILMLGCRTSHNGTGGFGLTIPGDRLAQVDLDPEVLGANYAPRWAVRGEVGAVLERLLVGLRDRDIVSDWTEQDVAGWRETLRRKGGGNPAEPRFPGVESGQAAEFYRVLGNALPDDAIVVTDTGHHQIMTREHLRVEAPRGLLVPSDFQSMGYGVAAAIGAALAAPERRVVAIVGDGGLMMSGLELATAVREGLDLCVIVFRDGFLGQIRSQQARSGIGEASVTLAGVDLEALAAATGAHYRLLEAAAGEVLAEAVQASGVTLVDVPLSSSPAIEKERKKGSVRQKARQALGPGGVDLLRRILRR